MRDELIHSIQRRMKTELSPNSPLSELLEFPVEKYIDEVISVLFLYTRVKDKKTCAYLSEVISAIGHKVRKVLRKPLHSAMAAKTGAFILYSFQEIGVINVILGRSRKKHAAYIVVVTDEEALMELWKNISISKTEKLPSLVPYAPWTSYKHETGVPLIKTTSKSVLRNLSPETHPVVFDVVNKAQSVGWRINENVYKIQVWALRNKAEAFSDIWEQQSSEARTTKLREARGILDIADRFVRSTFYHLYNYDFRGRKYVSTAYLHEQGSDIARGLLLRAEGKPITADGYFWLMVSLANNWAGDAGREDGYKTDKLPLKERCAWSEENEEVLLSYAESPKVNKGWMRAEKPWQFLAACMELMKLRVWQHGIKDFSNFEYPCHLEVFIDGSNNGSQHLAALTRDEVTAEHVNLVPSEMPGDLYKYVGEHVWNRLKKTLEEYSEEEIEACECFIDTLIDVKKRIHQTERKSEYHEQYTMELGDLRRNNQALLEISAPVYWSRIQDLKEIRKVVKRNIMTLPYGGTAYGLGSQQLDDAPKHGIEQLLYIEPKWASFMGRLVHADCKESLKRLMQLLSIFEEAGKKAETDGKFLRWIVPITDFLVVQHYTEGVAKKTWVTYGPAVGPKKSTGYHANALQLSICYLEETKPSKGKQAQGAAPNIIHSLDAAHMMLIVNRADFPVTTVHDSFGCHLADMPNLFRIVRETFVELYEHNPLESIMEQIEGDLSKVQFGTLDVRLILESEYAFS
jgi:hypothetical protein